ncbi:MAG: iron complex outermembrane receptor protein, partial [Flavobacteriales bacterium]
MKYKKRNILQFYIIFSLLFWGNAWLCQAAERYHFNLPAMNAAAALDKLADISKYSLIYPFDDSVVVITNPLFGSYSLADALEILLLNTPLS